MWAAFQETLKSTYPQHLFAFNEVDSTQNVHQPSVRKRRGSMEDLNSRFRDFQIKSQDASQSPSPTQEQI